MIEEKYYALSSILAGLANKEHVDCAVIALEMIVTIKLMLRHVPIPDKTLVTLQRDFCLSLVAFDKDDPLYKKITVTLFESYVHDLQRLMRNLSSKSLQYYYAMISELYSHLHSWTGESKYEEMEDEYSTLYWKDVPDWKLSD